MLFRSKNLKVLGYSYEIVGNGDTVLNQTPGNNDTITFKNSKIIIYTENISEEITVPSLVGLSLTDAVDKAVNAGLNIRINGPAGGNVISQSLPLGAKVKRGEVIELSTMKTDHED